MTDTLPIVISAFCFVTGLLLMAVSVSVYHWVNKKRRKNS